MGTFPKGTGPKELNLERMEADNDAKKNDHRDVAHCFLGPDGFRAIEAVVCQRGRAWRGS